MFGGDQKAGLFSGGSGAGLFGKNEKKGNVVYDVVELEKIKTNPSDNHQKRNPKVIGFATFIGLIVSFNQKNIS